MVGRKGEFQKGREFLSIYQFVVVQMKVITTSDNFIILEPCSRGLTARDCICVICFGLVFQVKNVWKNY